MANILLQDSKIPNQAPPFDQIKNADYLPAVEESIKQARAHIDAIKNNPAAPDFKNTIEALETSGELMGNITSIFYNQLSASGGDELHELAQKIGPITSNFGSDIILDPKLFERVKSVYDARESMNLTPEQMKLLDDSYKDFVRGGALLDEEKKQRLREISEQLSTLGPAFMNNVKKSAEAFELIIEDKKDLAGLPDSALEAAQHAAEEKGHKGKYLFTLDMPSYMPVVQYADNRELREKVWRAYASRAWKDQYDNSETVLTMVRLRDERAKLLGFKNHAEYVLERRMAEKPETVFAFLEKMKKAYKPAAIADLERLKKFAQEEHSLSDLKPWDVGYYSEKLKQKLFDFSSEDFRPYFPLDNVLKGVFTHFSKLFDIRFEDAGTKYPVWHKDVKAFDVYNNKDNKFVGTFYADFFPREGKSDGAWKTSYRSQGLYHGKVERPIIAIVCNFTKPTKDKPSLLTHDEVLTLFHEMGHAIHGLLSNVTYQSLAGTNVLWDFVELPSQVQENWCYEKETLDIFAGHYQTGEKIPADLIQKLVDSKNYMVGWAGLRQTSFGLLDMAWYTTPPEQITDVMAFEEKVTADTSLFPRLAGPQSVAFSHIFAGGYAAGYYSYKWAEVLDADTFEFFLERGLYDRATADKYKHEILERGGSEHPAILYRNFRGRDADPNALLRREGLKAA